VALKYSQKATKISEDVAYQTVLRPFSLDIRVSPFVHIQYKNNFGIYLQTFFYNDSPVNGQISQFAFIINNISTPEDKYLLTLDSFRLLEIPSADGDSIIATFKNTFESVPIFIEKNQIFARALNFVYNNEEQFPISMGVYECELLVWVNNEEKTYYKELFKFEITSDTLDEYKKRRAENSTFLGSQIYFTGYTPPLTSKKITKQEYLELN